MLNEILPVWAVGKSQVILSPDLAFV